MEGREEEDGIKNIKAFQMHSAHCVRTPNAFQHDNIKKKPLQRTPWLSFAVGPNSAMRNLQPTTTGAKIKTRVDA